MMRTMRTTPSEEAPVTVLKILEQSGEWKRIKLIEAISPLEELAMEAMTEEEEQLLTKIVVELDGLLQNIKDS
jgi:hypothetical protein